MFVFWYEIVVNRSVKHKQVVVSVPLSTVTIAQLVPDRYATSVVTLDVFGVYRRLGSVESVWGVGMCSGERIGQSGKKESQKVHLASQPTAQAHNNHLSRILYERKRNRIV